MNCPECGAEVAESSNFCPECNANLTQGGGNYQVRSESHTTSTGNVSLDEAAAVDIACPRCGEHPVMEVARTERLTGLLLAYRRASYNVMGCRSCVRRVLLVNAFKNLLLGWWSVKSLLMNPFLTGWNVARSLYSRGPNSKLESMLDGTGITYSYLDDVKDYESDEHSVNEVYVRGFVRLGCAVMMADDEAYPEERQAVRDAVTELFPDYPEQAIDRLISENADLDTDAEYVAGGLADLLTPEGKQLAVLFVASVSEAGVKSQEDIELAGRIADTMDMDGDALKQALQGEPEDATVQQQTPG